MNQTDCVKALLRDLKQDVERCRDVATLLEKQRQAMLNGRVRRCEEASADLMALYSQLQASARRRTQTLRGLKLSADSEGLRALLSRLPPVIRDKAWNWWHTLEQQVSHCLQANERNGHLLSYQRDTLNTLMYGETQDFLYSPLT